MKFTDDPALKLVSGPIAQAGCDDGLCDLRPCPDRFDEFPVHPRRQMSRICWASSRGSFRFDQMSVHPSVPALADITHNAIHDDRINVTAGRSLTLDSPSRRAGIADALDVRSALFDIADVGAVADLVWLAGDKAPGVFRSA
jgi:hypothetical protein